MTGPKIKVSSVSALLLCALGLAGAIYGFWMLFHPLGWIIGGLLVAAIALFVARETVEPE